MRKHVLSFILCSITFSGLAQNKVGIGSKNPTSTLTVEGSIAGGYREITTFNTPAKLEETDHYVTFNANGNGRIVLPIVGMGDTSLKGRIYKIKNISNYTVTITPALGEKFRNVGQDKQNIELKPGQYLEIVCNGRMLGTSTWDVSSISLGMPEEPPVLSEDEPIWQFSNIYDYEAKESHRLNASSSNSSDYYLPGFVKTLVIPANTEAKIVISYSIPVGSYDNQYTGYYGVTMLKNGIEMTSGSRKTSKSSFATSDVPIVMATLSATITDMISASSLEQRIEYKLRAYMRGIQTARFLMLDSDDSENSNWGHGYWSFMVYFK